ncbi:hypothetical protein [Streptomyces sp. A1136]|uniref:hypothetical protein n=1 Tax=Streptomyces sp. A1136 TaxID=2563102 RepID=UPI00109EA8D4|nr:hypothetical protein [Streptomyces sp. A1136]THA46538.1 hypothetical protein E6R62_33490 [Streptomyces sp. A1136]
MAVLGRAGRDPGDRLRGCCRLLDVPTIAELTASGLLESLPAEESRLRFTDAGRTLSGEIRAAGAEIAARHATSPPRTWRLPPAY